MTDTNIDKLNVNARTPADRLKIKVSESRGHQGQVANKVVSWPDLCRKLSVTQRDHLTIKEYKALSETERHKRKNQGYFVGGHFDKGIRKAKNLQSRTLLTFDLDECSVERAAEILAPFDSWLSDYEFFAYSTRSHTPDKPRLRVVVPVSDEVPIAVYNPLARIIASKIDPEMNTVDPVSFRPAQIMYWPSTCSDGEFVTHRNEGAILDYKAVLAEYGKWDDYANLPRSPREKNVREVGTKVQDPREKRGIVGAFCRSYTIVEAIGAFLSDVYVPGEDDANGGERWTYVPGSTTNGVVIYDDGMQAYSWHGTDPCADRLVNPFDMVRLHKFGHLDKAEDLAEGNDNPTALPSYKAMTEFALSIPAVAMEQTKALYDQEAMADDAQFEADPDEDDEVLPTGSIVAAAKPKPEVISKPEPTKVAAPERDWMEDLDRNDKGGVKSTLHNIVLIIRNDKRFKDALAYNQFTDETVVVRRVRSKQYGLDSGGVLDAANGDFLTGEVLHVIRTILEGPRGDGKTGWGLKVSDRDIDAAVSVVARDQAFHPIQRFIRACKWDGEPRIHRMLSRYWHAEDNAYTREVAFLFMVACVARAYEPGHKFDFVMILEGLQGMMKSSSLALLVGAMWFAEFTADVSRTDKVVENIKGKWLVEIGELVSLLRGDAEVLKAMFSATSDRARLAWGRGAKDYRRQTVFVGTTNKDEYFKDTTGNRRYWPVRLSGAPVDMAALAEDREQLWAEAREYYFAMRREFPKATGPLPLYIRDPEAKRIVEGTQKSRMLTSEEDTVVGVIHEWLETPVPAYRAAAGYRSTGDEDDDKPSEITSRLITCVADVAELCLGLERHRLDRRTALLIGRALSEAPGWQKAPAMRLGRPLGVQKVWIRSDSDDL